MTKSVFSFSIIQKKRHNAGCISVCEHSSCSSFLPLSVLSPSEQMSIAIWLILILLAALYSTHFTSGLTSCVNLLYSQVYNLLNRDRIFVVLPLYTSVQPLALIQGVLQKRPAFTVYSLEPLYAQSPVFRGSKLTNCHYALGHYHYLHCEMLSDQFCNICLNLRREYSPLHSKIHPAASINSNSINRHQ